MEALSNPQIGHRTPEISDMINRIILGVQEVLYTKNHIYLVSHAATGLWEMGIVNSVNKGILHAVNGAFSSKWASVSKLCGKDLGIIEYEWGRGILAEDVDDYLKTGKYNVFAMVHNETSTGVMSDLESISELLKSKYPDVIWLVDAVSSMAGVKIEVDRLGIDMILASTQKAWGLPAGFSICSVSERLISKYQFREYLKAGAAEVVMPDLIWTGGITETKKICTMAEAEQRPVAPHDMTGPVNVFTCAHISMNHPNVFLMETCRAFYGPGGWYDKVLETNIKIEDGHLLAPEGPGLGTRLRPDVFDRSDLTVEITNIGIRSA